MSYLAVNAFDADFTTIDINQRFLEPVVIKDIRVKLLKHGTIADGTLTLDVLDGAIVLSTASITAAQFNSVGATYAHGYFNFALPEQVVINHNEGIISTEVTYRLTMSGHTPDSNNYVALVRQFDDPFVGEFGDRPASVDAETDGWYNSIGIEVYGLEGKRI